MRPLSCLLGRLSSCHPPSHTHLLPPTIPMQRRQLHAYAAQEERSFSLYTFVNEVLEAEIATLRSEWVGACERACCGGMCGEVDGGVWLITMPFLIHRPTSPRTRGSRTGRQMPLPPPPRSRGRGSQEGSGRPVGLLQRRSRRGERRGWQRWRRAFGCVHDCCTNGVVFSAFCLADDCMHVYNKYRRRHRRSSGTRPSAARGRRRW